jgi:hypothetical protein
VIYQIYPRSYQDSNGDGVGDLKGITGRLSHIAELGADAIWISPFFKSPMKDFGYDVSNYVDIDPIFGTIADFDDDRGSPSPQAARDDRPRHLAHVRSASLVHRKLGQQG